MKTKVTENEEQNEECKIEASVQNFVFKTNLFRNDAYEVLKIISQVPPYNRSTSDF